MGEIDKCVEGAEGIYQEIKKIREKLESLNEEDPKSLLIFKPYYEKLLQILEKSKELASCPVPVIKVNGDCQVISPLEPMFFSEYTQLPDPKEPYTIIDDIRRHGKNGRLSKIDELLKDVEIRLDNYIHGVKECKVDFGDAEDEDIDSMMLELGLNPDEFIDKEENGEEKKGDKE